MGTSTSPSSPRSRATTLACPRRDPSSLNTTATRNRPELAKLTQTLTAFPSDKKKRIRLKSEGRRAVWTHSLNQHQKTQDRTALCFLDPSFWTSVFDPGFWTLTSPSL